MGDLKTLNKEPIHYNNYELIFYWGNYMDGSNAILCDCVEDYVPYPYATVSLNLGDYSMFTKENEIFFNHNLPTDFKEMFCDNFCTGSLNSFETFNFGPYDAKTQKVTIRDEFIVKED